MKANHSSNVIGHNGIELIQHMGYNAHMNYTQGPWSILHIGEHEAMIAKHDKKAALMVIVGHRERFTNPTADAHLISAAPEMYEALKRLVERIEHNGGIGEFNGGPAFVMLNAKNALAKAEGSSTKSQSP